MNIQETLRQQFAANHDILKMTMADVSADAMHRELDGATISNIAYIFAHAVASEDLMGNGMVRGVAPVWVTGGFAERTGVSPEGGYSVELFQSIAAQGGDVVNAYADAVFAATDAYLAAASDDEMNRLMDASAFEMGEVPVATFLGMPLIWHIAHHTGEIAALKGVMGHKGLPF